MHDPVGEKSLYRSPDNYKHRLDHYHLDDNQYDDDPHQTVNNWSYFQLLDRLIYYK